MNGLFLAQAVSLDTQTTAVITGVTLAVLMVCWFALRFWIISTRPPKISDIPMPEIDRLNRRALESLAQGHNETEEDDEIPADLREVAKTLHPAIR